jgi:Putative Actinobacterial Holin-X, holin superfamily III
MLDQTTMNGRRVDGSPAAGFGRNLAGLMHDLVCLGELQCQLFALDVRESVSRSVVPIGLIIAALLLALGTVPVVLAGIGWALVNLADLSPGAAFLIVSLISLVLVAGALWWSLRRIRSALASFHRSRQELQDNVRWIKDALKFQGTQTEVYRQRV